MNIEYNQNFPQWLGQFVNNYQSVNQQNISLLKEMYTDDIIFSDPLHKIEGIDSLTQYFEHLYQNMIECRFDVFHHISDEQHSAIYWTMVFRHKKIKSGNSISVEGHSMLYWRGDKVYYHRDYFDIGSMVYEHIPLLGSMIRKLKRRISQ
ncbi:MAG: nuclear transport factor 2 family protein [Kangiellaceae bacterium]|jgi:hypothetical protein|nr:nuclear transport factor 2 family protein [Kangiellaceae bacterium]